MNQGYIGRPKAANVEHERLFVAASPTGDNESVTLDCGDARSARLTIIVADVSGDDPGVTVTVKGREDPAHDWQTMYTGAELTDDGVQRTALMPLRYMQVAVAVTGEDGGSVGAVTPTVGTGPGFTLSGTPIVTGTLTVTITTGGAPGTAEFDWSLGEEGATGVAIPTTPFQVTLTGTGLTATFENDTFVEEDEFEAEIVATAEDTTANVNALVTLARE